MLKEQEKFDNFLSAISDMSKPPAIQEFYTKPKPFVKWVGGKRSIIKELTSRMPENYNRYFEPFIGGGALLFETNPKEAFISDMNQELIMTYLLMKNGYDKLLPLLDKHIANHSEEYYYQVRENDSLDTAEEIAARFIYLNKSGFNGLYRVNKKGKFNSPFGKVPKEKLTLYDKDNVKALHEFLQNVDIKVQSFENIKPEKDDFVYFDPPYHKVFTQYTDKDFGHDDQVALANLAHSLSNKGVFVMLSNSDTDLIRDLYSDFKIEVINASRSINCKANNRTGKEVVITNYEARWNNS